MILRMLATGLFLVGFTFSLPAADWSQWLGADRDGHAPKGLLELSALPATADSDWKLSIGGGFSSPVVAGDTLVYCDAQDGQEVAHALDVATGKPRWATPFAPVFGDEWGPGPRSTPIIDGDRVYVQSCTGEFRCLSLKDGKVIWGASFEKDFAVKFVGNKANEGTAARRGNNGCGIVDGTLVFVPVGSTNGATVVAFDKLTGQVVWKSGNEEAAYSSLRVADFGGVRQVIAFTADALWGMERGSGKILWRVPLRTNAKRHAATPVIFGDQVVVNSHTFGTTCFRISKEGETWKATEVWANKQMKINLASLVLVQGHLYGHGPAKNFVCLDAKTGELKWAREGFGKDFSATIALNDQRLLALTDNGELLLIATDPKEYRELGRVQVSGKTWSVPAVAQGRLIVREGLTDGWKLSSLKLAAEGTPVREPLR
jgi:outer membrane protein assembly factor BamB